MGNYDGATECRKKELRKLDRICDEAHQYVSLALLVSRTKDAETKIAIYARMAEIRSSNGLVQDSIDHHPDDFGGALVDLAAAGQRKDVDRYRQFLQLRMLQSEQRPGLSYGFDEIPLPVGEGWDFVCGDVACAV